MLRGMKEAFYSLTRKHRTDTDYTADITNSVVQKKCQSLLESIRTNSKVRKGVIGFGVATVITAIAAIPDNSASNDPSVQEPQVIGNVLSKQPLEVIVTTDGRTIRIVEDPNNPNNPR